MDKPFFRKLLKGIEATLEEAREIPPIIVRPSPAEVGKYEIIDGFHRWKAMTELGQERIGVFVIKVGDKTARVLTNTLNYLRGKPERAKYASGLVELIELGMSPTEMDELLPDSSDEINELLEEATISIKAFEALYNDSEEESDTNMREVGLNDEDVWVDLKFKVSIPQARVIESELNRIGETLKGRNVRGRALEFMASNSSGQPLPND